MLCCENVLLAPFSIASQPAPKERSTFYKGSLNHWSLVMNVLARNVVFRIVLNLLLFFNRIVYPPIVAVLMCLRFVPLDCIKTFIIFAQIISVE